MDRIAARRLARTLMTQHGVGHWHFKFDNAKHRFGLTSYGTRTISLSGVLTDLNPESEVRQVILHEIGHVLVGHSHGHDAVWLGAARKIGYTGGRCHSAVTPPARYQATCKGCNKVAQKHRWTAGSRYACTSCCRKYARGRFDKRFVLEFVDTKTGVVVR